MNFTDFKSKYQKVEVSEYPNKVLKSILNPVLSVHLVTYNHKRYIIDAIEGILKQETSFPFEIVIGDDDSSDGTREICIEYAERYPERIRLFLHRRENNIRILGKPCLIFQYTYNSFNLRGDFIAVVSGDDYWTDSTKLQKQYDFLSKNTDYSLCYHGWVIINHNSNSSYAKDESSFNKKILSNTPRALTLMFRNIYSDIPTQFVEVLAEDTFTKFILSTQGKKKFLRNIQPAVYREHPGSVWSSSGQIFKFDSEILSAEKMLEAYSGTPFQNKLEVLLIARKVTKQVFLYRSDKRSLFYILTQTCKKIVITKSPFKLTISGNKITIRLIIQILLIYLNNLKWKIKRFNKF